MLLLKSIGISLILMVAVIAIHYRSLSLISAYLPRLKIPYHLWIAVVIFSVYIAHILEISLFAVGYYVLHQHVALGSFSNEFEPSALNYFHFAATSYATLGMSAYNAQGGLKIIASLEALTGFLLITWSASFGYGAMRDFWGEQDS